MRQEGNTQTTSTRGWWEPAKASKADIFLNFSIGPHATEVIRAPNDPGWLPLQLIPNASLYIAAFLEPAGLPKAEGIIKNARSEGWCTPTHEKSERRGNVSTGCIPIFLKPIFATQTA